MAKIQIQVTHEIPDGQLCTIVKSGIVLPSYNHCKFRSSFYRENSERIVMCYLFNKKLKINEDHLPFKCDECLRSGKMSIESEIKILKEEVVRPKTHMGHIDKYFNEVVRPSGYDYFEWNGRVFKVHKQPYEDSGILYENL